MGARAEHPSRPWGPDNRSTEQVGFRSSERGSRIKKVVFDPKEYLKKREKRDDKALPSKLSKSAIQASHRINDLERYTVPQRIHEELELSFESYGVVDNEDCEQYMQRFFTFEQKTLGRHQLEKIYTEADELLNFKLKVKNHDYPPIKQKGRYSYPPEYFIFGEEKLQLPDTRLAAKYIREPRFVNTRNPIKNLFDFAEGKKIDEAARIKFPKFNDSHLSNVLEWDEKSLERINTAFLRLYPYLMFLTSTPYASFLDLIEVKEGQIPIALCNWQVAPGSKHVRENGAWLPNEIAVSIGTELTMFPISYLEKLVVLSKDLDHLINIAKMLYIVNIFLVPESINLSGSNVEEFRNNFPPEFFLKKRKLQEEAEEIGYIDPNPSEPPRFTLSEQEAWNPIFLEAYEKGFNSAESYRNSQLSLLRFLGDGYVPNPKNYYDIYNLLNAEERTPEKLEEARKNQALEDYKFSLTKQVMDFLNPPQVQPEIETINLTAENDFFDDEEGIFGSFEFEQNLEEGMARDLDGGSAMFPWDPG